jgi:hypothetical protein
MPVRQAQAQESGSLQAIATVLPALTVTGITDLNFGNVTPGTPVTVDKASVGDAGEFSVTGSPGVEITFDFMLPDSLRTGAGDAMDIVFITTDASYDDGTGGGQIAPAAVINPLVTETLNIGAGGSVSVWIGGRVEPGVSQTGGSYSGTVTLTVTLTGN